MGKKSVVNHLFFVNNRKLLKFIKVINGKKKCTTVIKACIDALNNVCNDSMTPPATSKMIPIVVSSTNAAVTNAAEGFMDSTNLPLILCSLNAIRKASSKEQDILKLCSLSAYIQRSLDSPTVLFSENEIKILEESLQLELAIEKDFDECAQDAAKNDKKIPACILVEEAAIQNPMDIFDDEEGETCDEKEPPRAEKIRQALNILIDKNPPSMISGTMAMTGRIGAALTGKTEVAFVDEAATVNQANVAAILAEIGTIKKTVFVGDSRQLQVYNRDVQDVLLDMGHRSILSVLKENQSPGILHTALHYTFRFHPRLLSLIQETCYPGMELKTTVLDKDRDGFDEIFSLQDKTPAFLMNVPGGESRAPPTSSTNSKQTKIVCDLIKEIQLCRKDFKVAVICLYNGQKEDITEIFQNVHNIKVSTVDGFQAREADVVIVVTSRSTNVSNNPFFNSKERVTVAMTRAQRGLILVGDKDALKSAPSWCKIVESLQFINAVYNKIPYKSTATFAAAVKRKK